MSTRRGAEALARSARLLTETRDVEAVGRRIVESLCEAFDVTAAGLRVRQADGALGLVAAMGDASSLPADEADGARASGPRSILSAVLRAGDRVTGVLAIAVMPGRVLSDDDATLLRAFADQAALALETCRSHAEVARHRHEAEQLAQVARLVNETLDLATVADRIADSVLALLDVQSSALRLVRPDGALEALALGGRSRIYAGAPAIVAPGVGLIGQAASQGRPMWTADYRTDARLDLSPEIRRRNVAAGIVAGLAVPLRVGGQVIGALSVGSESSRTFTEPEIALLERFADQAAVAIANAQSREALARQAERLRILHEIDRALIAEQAPVAIAEAVVMPLRELLGVPRVIVNLFDFEAGEIEWLAAAGRRRLRLGPGVRYPMALAGDVEALRRGEPQLMQVRALPPGPDAQALLDAGLQVYVVVPMMAAGELIGSVSVCDETGPFPPELMRIAREVADQLAIALAQARLHERVRRQAEELERRVEERTRELSAATEEADRANRAKSEFLGRMSHELRTPLNAILGFGQLLELDTLSGPQRESVEHILKAGRHLLGLIDEVLDISRIEAGRLALSLEPVPVRTTLRQALDLVRPLARGHDVVVSAEGVDEALHVLADRRRLQQVLLNLLSNAIKYNRPRGTVTAACARAPGDRLRISVTDTGAGIAPARLERLFVPFDRLGAEATGVEGTGLGLALSKSLVDAMGGRLDVQSRPGEGSTFSVELLIVDGPAEPTAADRVEAVAADSGRPGRTVLYIEDNVSNVRLVESTLAHRPGITVLAAMQGGVGLELARHHRPDLILLDRHLPDMTGDQVFAALREDARTRDIPVVILSADATPGGAQRLLDAGVHAYLTKPLDIRAFLAVVDETVRQA